MNDHTSRTSPLTPRAGTMFQTSPTFDGIVTRADLHVHTRASSGSATPWLAALGVSECYSEPEAVYDLALQRGMDLVAITDHDTLDGALSLHDRGFKRLIIGEEVTTRLTESQCVLHVLVWGMTPHLHEEIASYGLRDDAEALAHWLRDRRLVHALAHPLFDINRKLSIDVLRRCAHLFGGFEAINGGHSTARHRLAFERLFLRTRRHDASTNSAIWDTPWFTGGSDDHALVNVGRAWTATPGTLDAAAFLESIMTGASIPGGADATIDSFAAQFAGVAMNFASAPASKPHSSRRIQAQQALQTSLPPLDESKSSTTDGLTRALRNKAAHAVATWHRDGSVASTCHLRRRDLLRLVAPMALPQAAHVTAFVQQQRERRLLEAIERTHHHSPQRPTRIALFVDALDHTSGVSRFVLDLVGAAEQRSCELAVFTCGSRDESWPESIHCSDAIAHITLPLYDGVKLAVPWATDLLHQCADWSPDVIHVSTPGPVGIVGAIAAKALDTPLAGTHHTDFPAYAARLSDDARAAGLAKRALASLYSRFDRVLARSPESAARIEELNVSADAIRTLAPGIDTKRFSATHRNESIWNSFPRVRPSCVKALYVGRISKEKNLDLLGRVWGEAHSRLEQLGVPAELIVVGEGPYRGELSNQLSGRSVRFLGEQTGEHLATIYAASDFFVFPSTTDTLGQVVMEAQASGLPAIVSDQGGPSALVLHNRTGVVLSADAEQDWIRAIVLLAADGDRRRRLGRAAATHAQHFSFDRTFDSFWAIHEELVSACHRREQMSKPNLVVTPKGRTLRRPAATVST